MKVENWPRMTIYPAMALLMFWLTKLALHLVGEDGDIQSLFIEINTGILIAVVYYLYKRSAK
jgi:4-amino-4-deoxy-L-arabinose transferase-like glycosyltransferase